MAVCSSKDLYDRIASGKRQGRGHCKWRINWW